MSTAPRVTGVPNALIYGFILAGVLILLLCGGAGFYYLLGKGGSGGSSGNPAGKSVSIEDAMESAKLFSKDLSSEDYEHALKYRVTPKFRTRYSPDDLKDM